MLSHGWVLALQKSKDFDGVGESLAFSLQQPEKVSQFSSLVCGVGVPENIIGADHKRQNVVFLLIENKFQQLLRLMAFNRIIQALDFNDFLNHLKSFLGGDLVIFDLEANPIE